MMPTVQAKIIAALSSLSLLMVLGFALHLHGVSQGRKLERVEWQSREIERKDAEAALVQRHAADMAALQLQFNDINRKVSEDHETELEKLRAASARDRAAADRAGGLRVPRTICDRPAATAETAGAGGRDEAIAGTIRLPLEVENELWAAADAADEVVEQARSCQAWIRANGFYGPAMIESTALRGKIVAAPTQTPKDSND